MTPEDRKEHGALFLRYRQDGDQRAIQRLVEAYQAPLHAYLMRMLGARDRAEDAFQEVWLRAIRRADSYEEQGQFSSWLYRIAHNYCLDEYRRQGRENTVQEPELDSEASFWSTVPDTAAQAADERIYERELRERVEEAVEALPARLKDIYVLRTESDVPFKESAEIYECPIGTVLGWMHQAMKRIRRHLISSGVIEPSELTEESPCEKAEAAG